MQGFLGGRKLPRAVCVSPSIRQMQQRRQGHRVQRSMLCARVWPVRRHRLLHAGPEHRPFSAADCCESTILDKKQPCGDAPCVVTADTSRVGLVERLCGIFFANPQVLVVLIALVDRDDLLLKVG